jgi:uncharacterized membrane protein YgcG
MFKKTNRKLSLIIILVLGTGLFLSPSFVSSSTTTTVAQLGDTMPPPTVFGTDVNGQQHEMPLKATYNETTQAVTNIPDFRILEENVIPLPENEFVVTHQPPLQQGQQIISVLFTALPNGEPSVELQQISPGRYSLQNLPEGVDRFICTVKTQLGNNQVAINESMCVRGQAAANPAGYGTMIREYLANRNTVNRVTNIIIGGPGGVTEPAEPSPPPSPTPTATPTPPGPTATPTPPGPTARPPAPPGGGQPPAPPAPPAAGSPCTAPGGLTGVIVNTPDGNVCDTGPGPTGDPPIPPPTPTPTPPGPTARQPAPPAPTPFDINNPPPYGTLIPTLGTLVAPVQGQCTGGAAFVAGVGCVLPSPDSTLRPCGPGVVFINCIPPSTATCPLGIPRCTDPSAPVEPPAPLDPTPIPDPERTQAAQACPVKPDTECPPAFSLQKGGPTASDRCVRVPIVMPDNPDPDQPQTESEEEEDDDNDNNNNNNNNDGGGDSSGGDSSGGDSSGGDSSGGDSSGGDSSGGATGT